MTGVSRNNFVSLKGNLTTAIAESIGIDKDIIELPIRYQNGNEKKDVNEQPISRVVIKVTEDIDMVAVWKTTNDTLSFTEDLTTSMKMKDILKDVQVTKISKPLVKKRKWPNIMTIIFIKLNLYKNIKETIS